MSRLRCGPLAAWARAWLAGTAAFDDVLSAVTIAADAPALAMALPAGSPGPGGSGVGGVRDAGQISALGQVLIAWRQAHADVRLVLPVPGDTRGVPGPAAFRLAALDAGQAVVGSGAVGVVPVVVDHSPSSAPPTLTWRRFEIEQPVMDDIDLADAQYELTEAIRECASALARLTRDPAEGGTALNSELIAARRAGERINLPPSFAPKAVALVAQAERMAAVLALAGVGSSPEPDGRTDALAPLVLAVRRARLAGYNYI